MHGFNYAPSLCGNMLMKCAFAALEMREIENGWSPLGPLFTDDNSEHRWPIENALGADWSTVHPRNDEQR